MSSNYGLSLLDLQVVKDKLQKQRAYLENETFMTTTGQIKSLLDVSYSANHSERYFARVLNKVSTFVSYNIDKGNEPIFLTMTLDGYFRDFLKGDFSRFKEDDIMSIPNNNRFGYLRDKIASKIAWDFKDCYQTINYQYFRFLRSYTLQNLKKLGLEYSYIRVAEPHKDGVPHFHVLFYCPPAYIQDLKKEFEKFFPAPQNHKKINLNETKGFQTSIRSASAYVLKYILKTFRNVIEDKEPDYLDAWYTHNRVPRMITSHTLTSQDIYHRVALVDDDWYYISQLDFFRDTSRDFCVFFDGNRKIIINHNHCQVYNCGLLVREIGQNSYVPVLVDLMRCKFTSIRPTNFNSLTEYRFRMPKLHCKKPTFPIVYIYQDVLKYIPIKKIKSYALWDFYNNFPSKYNLAKYGLIKKELIERGLLEYEQINLNDYNSSFDFFCDDDWLRKQDLNL